MNYLNIQFSLFGEFMVKLDANKTFEIQSMLNKVVDNVQFFQSFTTGFNVDVLNNKVVQTKDVSYITEDNRTSITLSKNRIDFSLNQINLDRIQLHDVNQYFSILFEKLNLIPNRLALNTANIGEEFDTNKDNEVMKKYIIPIKYYDDDIFLEEWNVRFNKVHTLNLEKAEKVNVITQLTKVSNTDNPDILALMWQTDINTDANDLQPRFNKEHFAKFIDYAIDIHKKIIEN